MALLPSAFNPGAPGQEGITDFAAIDAGEYVAHIVSSKMVKTKAGDGEFLELIWQILIGDHQGRKLWSRLNLINNSTATVEIANKHLKSICDSIGISGPVSNSDVLHARACIIRVVKTPADSQYPEGNEIKNYAPYGTPGAGAVASPAAPAAAPLPAAVAAPAWGGAPAVPAAAPVPAVPAVAAPAPAVPAAQVVAPAPIAPAPVVDPAVVAPAVPAPAVPDPNTRPALATDPTVVPDAEPGAGPAVQEKAPWLR